MAKNLSLLHISAIYSEFHVLQAQACAVFAKDAILVTISATDIKNYIHKFFNKSSLFNSAEFVKIKVI